MQRDFRMKNILKISILDQKAVKHTLHRSS